MYGRMYGHVYGGPPEAFMSGLDSSLDSGLDSGVVAGEAPGTAAGSPGSPGRALGRTVRVALERATRSVGVLGDRVSEPVSDERSRELVLLARAGDEDAFAVLFGAYEPGVLRICRRMLGDADAALDARSEVFLRTLRALATFDTGRSFRPWLYGIAGNHCIDLLRRRAIDQRVFAHIEPSDAELEKLPAAGPGVSALNRLVAAEEKGALDRAIGSLPLEYRLPLMLRYFSDEDYQTIALALGVTTGQVGSLLFRAKGMLRERLARGEGDAE